MMEGVVNNVKMSSNCTVHTNNVLIRWPLCDIRTHTLSEPVSATLQKSLSPCHHNAWLVFITFSIYTNQHVFLIYAEALQIFIN